MLNYKSNNPFTKEMHRQVNFEYIQLTKIILKEKQDIEIVKRKIIEEISNLDGICNILNSTYFLNKESDVFKEDREILKDIEMKLSIVRTVRYLAKETDFTIKTANRFIKYTITEKWGMKMY